MQLSDADVMVGLWPGTPECTRKRFWLWLLFLTVFLVALVGLIICFAGEAELDAAVTAYGIFMSWVSFCLSINRMQDTGRSRWLMLLSFIPIAFVYPIYLICFAKSASSSET